MSSYTIAVEPGTTPAVRRPKGTLAQCAWITLVLWIASNLLVAGIIKFGKWEHQVTYHGLKDLCQWDCGWYQKVIEYGYQSVPWKDTGEANWPFHPLFPATAYPLYHSLHWSSGKALVFASKAELLFAIFAFLLLVSDQTETTADRFRAGTLVAFNPYIIYAHSGYAEPLYFGLIALAFYFARTRRWIASGALGGLASFTRFVGFLFSISYAVLWLRDWRSRHAPRKLDLNRVIGLLLCPLGSALFTLYMYHRLGDALVQRHAQVAWQNSPGNPFHTLWLCFQSQNWPLLAGLMVVVALVLSAYLIKIGRSEQGIFLALAILLPLSATYVSAPRYIWWEPPMLYAVYSLLKRRTELWTIYTVFACGMASFYIFYWFSGYPFVI